MSKYYNDAELTRRLKKCESDLYQLLVYNGYYVTAIDSNIAQIQKFYSRAFDKADYESTALEIVTQYETFIENAQAVKLGYKTADQAFESNHESTYTRKLDIVIHNIFKVVELLFWSLVFAVSLIALADVGIPLIGIEPLTGLLVSFATGALLLTSLDALNTTTDEFKSYDRVNKEEQAETNCFQFFANYAPKAAPEVAIKVTPEPQAAPAFA